MREVVRGCGETKSSFSLPDQAMREPPCFYRHPMPFSFNHSASAPKVSQPKRLFVPVLSVPPVGVCEEMCVVVESHNIEKAAKVAKC